MTRTKPRSGGARTTRNARRTNSGGTRSCVPRAGNGVGTRCGQTERVRNTLLASISHDFRTPLASILGSATSLLDYSDKLEVGARRELLGNIKNEAEDLDDMVRNLLAMTRIDAGALEVRREWTDLRELAERAANAARRRGARQAIEVRLPDGLPLVRADAKLVEQALGNVVGNAVTHTRPETHHLIDANVTAMTLRCA